MDGHTIAVSGNTDLMPKYSGLHLWVWAVIYRATPGDETTLSKETLLRITGITCHFCQIEYSRLVLGRLCRGQDRRL